MPNFDMWWLFMIVFEPKLPTSGGSPSPNSHMWVTGKPIVVEESAWPQMGILMFCQADRQLGFVHCIRFSTDPSYAENQDVMLGKEVNHPVRSMTKPIHWHHPQCWNFAAQLRKELRGTRELIITHGWWPHGHVLTDARLQQEGLNSLMHHGCHLGHVACAMSASVVCRGQKIRASSTSEKWNDCTVNIGVLLAKQGLKNWMRWSTIQKEQVCAIRISFCNHVGFDLVFILVHLPKPFISHAVWIGRCGALHQRAKSDAADGRVEC